MEAIGGGVTLIIGVILVYMAILLFYHYLFTGYKKKYAQPIVRWIF